MAIISNINDKFAVDSTGAIQFNGQAGTSGYILKSNGNAAPTWVDPDDVIGGPYLPLTGGTLTGNLAISGSNSLTVGGALTANGLISINNTINVNGGNSMQWYASSTNAKMNMDARVSGTGVRIHKWNRNANNDSYLPYYENWYDGNSYHNIGIEANVWRLSDGLEVDGDTTVLGNLKVVESVYQSASGGGYINKPYGGNFFNTQNAFTGAIQVALPTGGTGHDDMIKFVIDIYDYATQQAVTVFVGGYTYQNVGSGNNTWTNVQAQVIGQSTNQNYTVRFGDNGTEHCVWVGETNSTWNHLQVIVRDFFAGYSASMNNWIGAWNISVVTTQTTVNNTLTNNFPMSKGDTGGPYLPLTGGTLTGNLTINGSNTLTVGGNITANDGLFIHGTSYWVVSSSDAALQRADARDDATNFSRLHWYGENDTGGTSNFRHAYYDGSSYINVTAAGGVLNFTGQLETTTLRTDVLNNKANSANIIYRSGTNTIVGGGSGSNKLYVADDGNVGVGTSDPDHKLEVLGGIAIRNANSRLYFGTNNGTDRRALEGNVAGTLLQIGESYSNTQMYNDVQVTGALTTGEGIVVGGSSGYQIPVAYSVGNAGTTSGAIKIQLPQAMTNTMMMFKVRVFEYNTFESFDVTICGYNYNPTKTWYNVSAWIDSNPNSDRNFSVRLGYDATATRAVAYIGELNSVWSYPQVWVTEWNGGHSNQGANWHYGYQISFETSSFTGVTQTIPNTQINSWARAGTNLNSGAGVYEVQVVGNNSGSSFRLGGGVAPNGTAQIVSTSGGVGGSTKYIRILNDHFAFDHGTGSSTTFIGNASYEIQALGAIIGYNMYARGSTVGISSGGSFVFGASTSEGVYIQRPANTTDMYFVAGGNTRMVIENNGEVGINNTSPSATLHLTATASNGVPFKLQGHGSTTVEQMLMYTSKAAATNWYWLVAQANSANTIIIYGNGNINNANNSYGQLSDIRLKENVIDATSKLEDVKKLKVKNFNFKGDNLKQIGLIAQEVEEVFPGLVEEDKQPDIQDGEKGEVYKSVKYSVLVPILIKAIQELEARVKELENK